MLTHPASVTPLFPLSQGLFPDSVLSLTIFEVRYLHLIKRCQQEGIAFGVVPLRAGSEVQKAGEIEQLHAWGCLAELVSVSQVQPAVLSVTIRGGQRFHLGEHSRGAYGLWSGEITRLANDPIIELAPAHEALSDRLAALIQHAIDHQLEERLPFRPPYRLKDTGWIANRWADLLPLPVEEKAALLAESDCAKRLDRIAQWLPDDLEDAGGSAS